MNIHDIHRRIGAERYAPSELGECQRPAASPACGGSSGSSTSSEYTPAQRLVYEAQIAMMMWRLDVEDGETDDGLRDYQMARVHAACRNVEDAQ